MANLVVAQLLFLESENPDKDIALYINSPGGSVSAGLAIYDTMQFIKPDVSTICVGQAASMGAVLLAGGAKGKRFALPHSRIMIHQPLRRVSGPGHRHRHPCPRNPGDQGAPERDPGQAHRPDGRADQGRHRPRQLHERRGRGGLRPDRSRAGEAPRDAHGRPWSRPRTGQFSDGFTDGDSGLALSSLRPGAAGVLYSQHGSRFPRRCAYALIQEVNSTR